MEKLETLILTSTINTLGLDQIDRDSLKEIMIKKG